MLRGCSANPEVGIGSPHYNTDESQKVDLNSRRSFACHKDQNKIMKEDCFESDETLKKTKHKIVYRI